MPTYGVFFSYTPESWARMIKNPGDREAAIREPVEKLGGTLESMWFMFGERDGMIVVDMPDSTSVAAVSIAVSSTGALRSVDTRELIAPGDLPGVLQKAGAVFDAYRPPGA